MAELYNLAMQFPYTGIFCLLILGSIGFPFPEDAILLSCGFLISRQIILPLPAFLAVYGGILIGDFIIYSLGKKYGRAVLARRMFRRVLSVERLHALEAGYQRFGVLTIILGRQIIGLRAQVILAAGILGMPRRRFLATDACASAITIMLIVSLGYTGTQNMQALYSLRSQWEYLLAFLLFFVCTIFLAWRYRSKQRIRGSAASIALEETGA